MIKTPTILPPNKQWNEPNTGYLFGSIYQTQNISMDIAGVISLSKRAQYVGRTDTSGSPRLGYTLSITYDGQALTGAEKYYILGGTNLYRMSQAFGTFEVDPTDSQPTFSLTSSDAVMWTDGLYCSTTSNVSKLSAGAWTGSQMSFTNAGIPHPLCVSASANYLLGGNGNLLRQKDPSTGAVTTALTLPANYRIQWIRSDYSRTLIGCRNMNGGNTAVFEWDEVSPTWTNKYDVDCQWVLSGAFRNTDFFVVTNDGRLMKFNGGGFSTVSQLPIYKTLQGDWESGFALSVVHQRGMDVIEGRINIMLSAEINGSSNYYPNFLSGIWEFDESTGLNHKYGATYSTNETDFVQIQLGAGAGAIASIVIDPITGGPNPATGGILLFGARVDADGSNGYYELLSLTTDGPNRGSFVTTRIETQDIADDSKKLWVKYRGLFTQEDKIIFKIKEKVRNGLPFTCNTNITWLSTTSFTTNATDVAQWVNVLVGDEVTVLNRTGAGAAANISSISTPIANVYTVTLGEAILGVTAADTALVLVDNFRLLETTITSSNETGYEGIPFEQTNPSDWIQVKVEMRGSYLVTIEELQIVSASHVLPTP